MKTRKIIIETNDDKEIIEYQAKKFGGNASHIILPSKYIGKKVIVFADNKIILDIKRELK